MVVQQQTDLSRLLTCHRTQSRKINKASAPRRRWQGVGVFPGSSHTRMSLHFSTDTTHTQELLTRLWPALEVTHFNLACSPKGKGKSVN